MNKLEAVIFDFDGTIVKYARFNRGSVRSKT